MPRPMGEIKANLKAIEKEIVEMLTEVIEAEPLITQAGKVLSLHLLSASQRRT